MRQPAGFTLIEVFIALTALAVLGAIALPAFDNGMQAAHATETRTALLDSVLLAVSRSALTGNHVVLCPSVGGSLCDNSIDWSTGWLVFVDVDQDRQLGAGERPALRVGPQAEGIRLASTVGRTRIVFQGNGGNAGSNVTFTLCDGRGPGKAIALILNNQGRLREARPSDAAAASTCLH